MTVHSFNVVYEELGDGWVSARVPELPEVQTRGKSLEQTRKMVRHAVALALEGRHAREEEIPPTGWVLAEPIEIDEDAPLGHESSPGNQPRPDSDSQRRPPRPPQAVTDIWGNPISKRRRRR